MGRYADGCPAGFKGLCCKQWASASAARALRHSLCATSTHICGEQNAALRHLPTAPGFATVQLTRSLRQWEPFVPARTNESSQNTGLPAHGPRDQAFRPHSLFLFECRMWSAVRGAGAEAKTLVDMDVERASQAATPDQLVCHRTDCGGSPKRIKARSKTFDLGTVYVCV